MIALELRPLRPLISLSLYCRFAALESIEPFECRLADQQVITALRTCWCSTEIVSVFLSVVEGGILGSSTPFNPSAAAFKNQRSVAVRP